MLAKLPARPVLSLVLPALLIALTPACGGSAKPSTDTPVPEASPAAPVPTVRPLADLPVPQDSTALKYFLGLDSRVRQVLSAEPWIRSAGPQEMLLLQFLYDASRNQARSNLYPTILVENRDPLARTVKRVFDAEKQLSSLQSHFYDYVSLGNKDILVVVSSESPEITRADVDFVIAMARDYFPKVDELAGGDYRYGYLHIQLLASNYTSQSGGANIFFKDRRPTPTVLVHERTHNYNNTDSKTRSPRWYAEGEADEVARILTGRATYPSNGAPVNISDATPLNYGNAALVLDKLYKAMPRDAFLSASGRMNSSDVWPEDVFDIFYTTTPDNLKPQIRDIICKNTNSCP